MIFETILVISYFVIIYSTSLGYGYAFNSFFLKDTNNNSKGEIGIYGLFFLGFLSIFFNFFIPLNYLLTSIICTIGITIFIFLSIYKKLSFKFINIFLFALIIPTAILFEYHADYFWYHLPYVNIKSEFNITFGLANLNDNLGYSHVWYDIMSIFNLPFYNTKYLSIVAIVFLFFFIILLKDIFLKTKEDIIKKLILLSICFVGLIYSDSKDYGSEIQINLIYIVISIYICLIFYNKDIENNKNFFLKVLLLFFFAILIRTNAIIFFPLIIIFIIFYKNIFFYTLINNKIFYVFIFLFSFLYVVKNLIITGCLAYPIYFTCFDTLDWGVGIEHARYRFYHLSAQSKGYLLWLLNENLIKNIFDYYNYRETIFFESPESYLKNKNWVKYWWKYEYDINRFLNILYFFIIFVILNFIFNFKDIEFKKIFRDIRTNAGIILLFLFPFFSWLYLLPQTRYGGYGIIFIFLGFFCLNFFSHLKKNNFYPIILLLFISFVYFEGKNYTRIFNNYNLLKNNQTENFYNYPLISNEKIIKNTTLDIEINEISLINNKIGEPLYCYNTKGLCASSFRINCISKITKINNYIFIKPNKKLCADLINKYLWY